jgi:integrase
MADKSTESINFYLRKGEGYKNAVIYLQFWFNNTRLRYNLKEKINPDKWNPKKQKVKDGTKTADGKHSLNDFLDNVADIVKDAYRDEKVNGIPTPAMIKKYLDGFMNQNRKQEQQQADASGELIRLIERYERGEVDGQKRSEGTLKNYRVTKQHLLDFAKLTSHPLDFAGINLDFYGKFVKYLQTKEKPLSTNSTGNMIKNIKLFMGAAVDLRLTTNRDWQHKKFKKVKTDTDAVYLTESDLTRLYNFDFTSSPRLEGVRDMFVFACWTGLRVSDFKAIKPENIRTIDGETFVIKQTQKTKGIVYIHCNEIVMDIFNKYRQNPNRLPKAIADQNSNLYIKECCRIAGLTDKGRLVSNPDDELCDLIKNHTARRSFSTNYYLQGFPIYELMKITGHKSEKAFMAYIKTTSFDAAKLMAIHNKKRNWQTLLGGLQEEPKALKVAS